MGTVKAMKGARQCDSKELKLVTIALYENGKRSLYEVERELGITQGMLGKWIESLHKQTKQVYDNWNGKMPN